MLLSVSMLLSTGVASRLIEQPLSVQTCTCTSVGQLNALMRNYDNVTPYDIDKRDYAKAPQRRLILFRNDVKK